MCGIIGYSGNLDPAALLRGNDLQRHRGPDDEGVFFDRTAGVGLGHRRLSILDLSALGHQPMECGGAVIVFNGEIYNFRELRKDLEGRGVSFRSGSDTEVLLQLYLAEGDAMLPKLNGIFAFAVWDPRDASLLVARDALGVKPLYVAETARGVAFASEIKALLPLVPNGRELDLEALHRYMSFLWCPGEGTPLKQVRKLPPGGALRIRDGKVVRRWLWYELPAARGIVQDLSEADAIEGTVRHLRTAVQRQLVADVPVGAFLSGGLDSSSVVAFAREADADLQCFTIEIAGRQDEGVADDLPYAERVARALAVPLHKVTVDADRMAADLPAMIAQLDEPLADPSAINVLYISQLAREHGMKVLLSGAGGDDLFTGYRRHLALQHEAYWRWLPAPLLVAAERYTQRLDHRTAAGRRLGKLFGGAALSGDPRVVHYFSWAKESELFGLYTADVRARLTSGLAVAPMHEFLATLPSDLPRLERMLALEQRFFLTDHNLIYTDKMSMAAGVEVRVPFLDLDLVDFAARIPPRLKQHGRIGKWVLKRAMEPFLPRDVIYRPKTGFGAPLRRWMRDDLRPLVRDLLSIGSVAERGIFDPAAVQDLIRRNEEGRVDAAYLLLSLLSIEIWCRNYLDGQMPAAAA